MKTTVTERGQISIPAELRREMNLKPGQIIVWEKLSANECRLIIERRAVIKPDPLGALNFASEHGLAEHRSDEVLAKLREGEN